MLELLALSDNIRHILAIVCAAFYFSAFAGSAVRKVAAEKIPSLLWSVGTALNALIVVSNWAVNGYMPFVSMYQVLTFLALTYSFVFVYVKYRFKGGFMKPSGRNYGGRILYGSHCFRMDFSACTAIGILHTSRFLLYDILYLGCCSGADVYNIVFLKE